MKQVELNLTITIDEGDWITAFGSNPEDISDDVRRYFLGMLDEARIWEEINGEVAGY